MNKFPENIPREDQPIIAYLKNGGYFFSIYRKVLTWKGRKFKFVNLMSKGLWFEDYEVEGWNPIPNRDQTIKN